MAHEFQGTLYPTREEMLLNIAEEYITAGGDNPFDVVCGLFYIGTNEALAQDALSEWGLGDVTKEELAEAVEIIRCKYISPAEGTEDGPTVFMVLEIATATIDGDGLYRCHWYRVQNPTKERAVSLKEFEDRFTKATVRHIVEVSKHFYDAIMKSGTNTGYADGPQLPDTARRALWPWPVTSHDEPTFLGNQPA